MTSRSKGPPADAMTQSTVTLSRPLHGQTHANGGEESNKTLARGTLAIKPSPGPPEKTRFTNLEHIDRPKKASVRVIAAALPAAQGYRRGDSTF
ncbi:hypothetical protein ACOMHN_046283 [Nucella lapillus]